MLLDSIRHTSIKLSENMEKFRNKSSKLLNGGIKDGVLDEAQHRLTEIAQLVSSSFLRHSSVSVDSTSTNDGPILNSSGENSPVDNSPLSSDSGEE
uniref:Uncharacterized protein n=1 Tax=Acrobeloides nanus TaxID=290746 RepID=A0A914DDW4_9BILA